MMEITEGSHAVAEAVRLCRPQVVSAYPITPQTHIVEALADFVANGQLDAEYITVENELSALSACVGASAAGSRTYSATTSQGLDADGRGRFQCCRYAPADHHVHRQPGSGCTALDLERPCRTRSRSGMPAGSSSMPRTTRKQPTSTSLPTKWPKIPAVQLPAFVCFDGFILSHTYEPMDMLTQEQVDRYLPKFNPAEKLDAKDPISFGMYATPEYYLEFRYEMDQAQKRAKDVIAKAGKEFGTMFGRDYSALVEGYRLDDAETAIVAMGSICGTVKDAIDEMRAAGKKVGLLKIRVFRPFPSEEIAKALCEGEAGCGA